MSNWKKRAPRYVSAEDRQSAEGCVSLIIWTVLSLLLIGYVIFSRMHGER